MDYQLLRCSILVCNALMFSLWMLIFVSWEWTKEKLTLWLGSKLKKVKNQLFYPLI